MDAQTRSVVDKRLAIALGHLKKVREMVGSDRYCIDILQQSMAVQASLKRIDEIMLKDHLETCVADAISGGEKDKVVQEVIDVFQKGR